MIALTAGVVHYLIQGQDYALPASPCQILCPSNAIMINGQYRLGSEIEPGTFNAGGGTIRNPDAANQPIVIKKHTIGTSKTQTPYSAAVLMDKPSYYWRLNEPNGIARELIQGLNGTVSGGVTYAQPGALVDGDKAMAFGGVDGKIVTSGNVTAPTVLTVEAWIKQNTITGRHEILTITQPGVDLLSFFVSTGLPTVSCYVWSGQVLGVGVLAVGVWHHLVFVMTATKGIIYVDGIFNSEQTFSPARPVTTGIASLGWDTYSGLYYLNGSLDEVAIYPYALTPAQISQHYLARSSPYVTGGYASKVIASNPSNYWRLGETYGSVARDIVGGADGTISGGVTLNGVDGMMFNGTTGNVLTSVSGLLPAVVTIEAWIKTISIIFQSIVSTRNPNVAGSLLASQESTGRLSFYVSSGSTAIASRVINDGQWHHVVYVLNGSTIGIYIDGMVDINVALVHNAEVTPRPIGIAIDNGTNFFNGSIDEVSIYPRALTASEILSHYQSGRI